MIRVGFSDAKLAARALSPVGSRGPSLSSGDIGISIRHARLDAYATLGSMLFGRMNSRGGFFRLLAMVMGCILGAGSAMCQTTAQIRFRLQTREVVEEHLKSFSTKNSEREGLIRKWLTEAGCKGENLSEQALDRKFPPNVICVLPGETQEAIVIGAHTDHVDDYGDGVVDNWTGAALLPALLYSLSAQSRHHTLIFIGFSAEEKWLVGSRYYVDHLSSKQRARIDGMVNVDSLGLGPTEVWVSNADKVLVDALAVVAHASKLGVTGMNVPNGATADSESFAHYHIPRITLHSVTPETWSILHSSRDKISAVKMNDYYDSYKLIAEYLAYLDGVLKPGKASQ